jgi:hypothetical protein
VKKVSGRKVWTTGRKGRAEQGRKERKGRTGWARSRGSNEGRKETNQGENKREGYKDERE